MVVSSYTSVSFVNVPAGTKLYAGKANNLFNLDGGGYQFYIDKVSLGLELPPREWFSAEPIPIDLFLNN